MNEQQLQSLANHLNQSRQEFVTALNLTGDVLNALNDNIKDFRAYLESRLTRVQEDFSDEQLAVAVNLAENQKSFQATAEAICDMTEMLSKQMRGFDEAMTQGWESIDAHNNSAKAILEMFPKFFAAFTETNANVEENSRKLDAFILKMESYFGSGQGLDYDN
jgi:predicted phage tail protein